MEGKKQGKGKVKTKDGKEMEGLFEESKSKGVEGVPLFETIKVSEYFNIWLNVSQRVTSRSSDLVLGLFIETNDHNV